MGGSGVSCVGMSEEHDVPRLWSIVTCTCGIMLARSMHRICFRWSRLLVTT
jgi:hypothetical protein